MFEFITLSRDQAKVNRLQASITAAMGGFHPWRLNVIDGNVHTLFSGYNKAIADTQGEYLVFVHDDVQLLCNYMLIDLARTAMDNELIGFVGVAGTRLLDESGAWYRPETRDNVSGMVFHPSNSTFGMHASCWLSSGSAEFTPVVVLDGVLLACHRRTITKIGAFEEAGYPGFHFYDLDITFRAHLAGLTNLTAPLPILHDSAGKFSSAWKQGRLRFLEKFAGKLPASVYQDKKS